MARISVTTNEITRVGVDFADVATAPTVDGDVIDSGAVYLEVDNADAAAHTVTVQSPVAIDGLDLEELVTSVPAGGRVKIGPFPKRTFGRPVGDVDEGRVYVDYDSITGLTRAVFKL